MIINFLQAVLLMQHGHKMRRKNWLTKEYYIIIRKDQFWYQAKCQKSEGPYILNLNDIIACDWEEYREY
jgi:hypothetical protein